MYLIKGNYRLKKMAKLVSSANRVLDLGCMQQPNVYLNNKMVIGMDLNNGKLPPNYKELVVGDVMNLLSFFEKDFFDAIVAGEIIEHLERPIDFLRNCYEIMSSGGQLVISTPNPHSIFEFLLTINLSRKYFYHPVHVCLYPQRWLIRMFERVGFKNVQVIAGGTELPIIGTVPSSRLLSGFTIVKGVKP